MKIILLLLYLILIFSYCKEKNNIANQQIENDVSIRKHKELSQKEIQDIQIFLKNFISTYHSAEPDIVGKNEHYTGEAISTRIEPIEGFEIPVLNSLFVESQYTIEDLPDKYIYWFSIKFETFGRVNITKLLLNKNKGRINRKFGVINEKGKWKIHVDGNPPVPVPLNILIEHYKLNKNQKMVSELEAWEKEINGKKKESTP